MIITKIDAVKKEKKKLRVAAYARVSTDSLEQLNSLEVQKEYFEKYIKSNSEWEYAGLYFDEGISGTKMARREGLKQMLDDCEGRKIDFIITKSISRFARNTIECVETVRRLLDLKINIFFEKENIDTGKMEGELLLSLLSSLAENESRSNSKNQKWAALKRAEAGVYVIGCPAFGYDNATGVLKINKGEAEIVRRIYQEILEGKTSAEIAYELNEEGLLTKKCKAWSSRTIASLIKNEFYYGDFIYQKTFNDDNFNKKRNIGQLPKLQVINHHEPIIDKETFDKANKLLKFRAKEKGNKFDGSSQNRYTYSTMLYCGECGGKFKRRYISNCIGYACKNHIEDSSKCHMLSIRKDVLDTAFVNMMNKLIFARSQILIPYQKLIQGGDDTAYQNEFGELNAELEYLIKRKYRLNDLLNKEIIDKEIYTKESQKILMEENDIRTAKHELREQKESFSKEEKNLEELIHFTYKREYLKGFDDALFLKFVDRVTICKRDDICFSLKCGLNLHERIEQ